MACHDELVSRTAKCPLCLAAQPTTMAEELAMVRRNVEREDAVAIRHLARAYQAGNWEIAVNLKKAAKLYKRAAELGDADACFSLAYAYDDGDGVRQSKAKALAFWRRAAAQDHDVRTKCNAETVLFLSLSIASDGPTPEAVALVRDAAGRGYAEAEYHLADLHLDGAGGVPQDTREAKRLLANAAGKGYDDARAKLADLGSSLVEIED